MRTLLLIAAAASGLLRAGVDWPAATPRSQGFDPARLEALRADAAARHTRALLVVRNGRIVLEWYAAGNGPDTKQGTASLAKALVGGMPLLVALNDGRIRPDDLAAKFIPRWQSDARKSRITIRQLATHTSGIEDAEQDDLPHGRLPGWKGAFWTRKPDPISIALDQAPMIFQPGTGNEYSNPGMAALAYVVTASLRGAPESDIREVLKQRICEPTGIPESDWRISYDESYLLDGLRVYANWGGASFTPRATARTGQLMLQKGAWEGRQLLQRQWVETVTSNAGMPKPGRAHDPAPASGLCWYTNYDGVWSGVPRDAFAGAGANQQALLVVPSLNLVVVRNGAYLGPEGDKRFWGDLVEHIFEPAVAAIASASPPPYRPSPVIRKIAFDPAGTILRKAPDSDNWPITWADDGDLYTAYGDGHGFEPLIQPKLSLGLAKVSGTPPTFTAENIRSETAERTGGGAKGAKASGMLMVDGVLYMWVRNVGNSQLAWSSDHGRSWQWSFKLTEGFGSPAFLNFGKNYAGARDSYVYTYSQDGPSAYESSDGLVLARVARSRMRDREAYEFFVRLDPRGRPVWTRDIAQRGPVFSYPGHCLRADAVYHPALKRYLLALGYNQDSGWGIYDAPEPWGPWTTAFHTESWDIPGTHGYRLPSKWIAVDGRSMYLVYSGVNENDAFCVRRMTVEAAIKD
ncbi:Beta-lactamase [Candidatus Sulfopaludibacter sp. SbA3]|nr:Beta-lactamase [Candidatus Sulfopaludibacter sp. SbA3]